jgi:hypothetical protein
MNSTATSTRRPSRRFATAASLVAVPAAIAVSGLVVSQASYSAYSATTVNPTNNWATGTVALADDDTNTAAFTATNLKPGSTGTKCLAVTSSGSLASTVKLYATNPASTKNLAANIDVTISQGTGGSFGSCAGFTKLPAGADLYAGTLDQLGTSATGFTTGLGDWAPTGKNDETRVYQITYTVNPKAPDTTQGGTAALGLTFEAQNS